MQSRAIPILSFHRIFFTTTSLWLFLLLQGGVVSASRYEVTCDADGVCTPVKYNNDNCEDYHDDCATWASQGECDANPKYMLVQCQKSCFVCGDDDYDGDGSEFGVPQTLGNPNFFSEPHIAKERLVRVHRYMQQVEIPPEIKEKCRNLHEECINWAVGGECDGNPIWMKKECAPACHSCDFLVFEARCPIDVANLNDVWKAGDLDRMFEKLTSEPYLSKYSVKILSSPSTDGPWVIQLDNVLTKEEADHLIELGGESNKALLGSILLGTVVLWTHGYMSVPVHISLFGHIAIEGYQRSADVGKLSIDGSHGTKISDGRTSTNAWCRDLCYQNATAQAVMHRLSDLTGVPEENSEYLQMLRYEPGQYYHSHHDYIGHHIIRQQGPRILTFYLYLNDVKAGGGTHFDKLDITVTPQVGRAILWPSVKNEFPSRKDDRTMHAALPVDAGIKYGANAWFHLRNFKDAYATGCI